MGAIYKFYQTVDEFADDLRGSHFTHEDLSDDAIQIVYDYIALEVNYDVSIDDLFVLNFDNDSLEENIESCMNEYDIEISDLDTDGILTIEALQNYLSNQGEELRFTDGDQQKFIVIYPG